jgi:hypothetical protein
MNSHETEERNHAQLARNKGKRPCCNRRRKNEAVLQTEEGVRDSHREGRGVVWSLHRATCAR